MMIKKQYLQGFIIFSFLFSPFYGKSATNKEQVWILVHGTFAQEASKAITRTGWWRPEHKFRKELAQSTNQALIYGFNWCGSNSHEKRIDAGKKLATFITTIASKDNEIHIIGHSHGANVAILGAQELVKKESKITIFALYSLGVPVATAYYPSSLIIRNVYNLFSYGDLVQPIIGLFGRVFPEEQHIHNLQVKINHYCPNHYHIHDPIIARYLPELSNLIPNSEPHLIHFFNNKLPIVTPDFEREKDLKIDKNFTTQLITSFAESKKHGYKTLSEISEYTKARFLRLRDRGDLYFKSVFESKN